MCDAFYNEVMIHFAHNIPNINLSYMKQNQWAVYECLFHPHIHLQTYK